MHNGEIKPFVNAPQAMKCKLEMNALHYSNCIIRYSAAEKCNMQKIIIVALRRYAKPAEWCSKTARAFVLSSSWPLQIYLHLQAIFLAYTLSRSFLCKYNLI